ncbi:MAG: hypothetical protein QOK25_2407 [Thermoleophilaceae bacterium]|nr:hypothetical protein [Thermoleophilaceae bacterium]
MIVDRLTLGETAAGVERAARVRWRDGEFRVTVTVPAEFAHDDVDGSPFLCATLLPAMRAGEHLEVDGPVSRRLLAGAAVARDTYLDWCPDLYPSRLSVAGELELPPRADGVGCFFSRGVDSTFSIAQSRPGADLTRLLYVDRLEPRHDQGVRAEEIRRAHLVAERAGLPLTVIDTNLREFTDGFVRNWEDMAGAGLAFVANALAAGIRRVVIPSTDGPLVGPCGTSPLLDPLFSTELVDVVHDSVSKSRVEKVFWLARERHELVSSLKVCFEQNVPGNCGRCSKCLVTMVSLEAAGVLHLAEEFPPLDLDTLDAIEKPFRTWTWFAEAAEALDPVRQSRLRELVLEGARPPTGPPRAIPEDSPNFRSRGNAKLGRLAALGDDATGVEEGRPRRFSLRRR